MNEYIEKNDIVTRLERVIKYGKQAADGTHPISAEVVLEVVNSLTATDVVGRKKGEWHDCYHRIMPNCYVSVCSSCGKKHEYIGGGLLSYCPNCGADMRGDNG